ncbi:hypothetical protein TrVE_jg3345 [Triparma verrucosa]|uniref:Tyrosine-protein kinase ephrin type A/B receptor-like domain-containing protein n=1 Tax=Triparma verrucosa TaxID=1606542 RepID=A0A9W7EL86_9STRA|nr:hypothetical protein TrVE_jg3345 [Triparma verrucosa]
MCAAGLFLTDDSGLDSTLHDSVEDCTICSNGKFSGEGADICTNCGAGRYLAGDGSDISKHDDESDCLVCRSGTYQEQDVASSCESCVAGTYLSDDGVDISSHDNVDDCSDCASGKYSGSSWQTCSSCSAGKFLVDSATDTEASACSDCDAGKRSGVASLACDDCDAGKYSDSSSEFCTDCDAGKYSMVSASAVCTDCDAGKFSGAAALTCGNCAAGKYSESSSESCTNCDAGKYSSIISESCTSCSPGKYSGTTSSECVSCAAGKYLNDAATGVEAVACSGCGAGRYNAIPSANSEEDCLPCSSGRYSGLAKSECLSCSAGKHLKLAGTGNETQACALCGVGRYSGEGERDCQDCPAGKKLENSAVGNVTLACSNCQMGLFSPAASTECSVCVGGKHIVEGKMGGESTVCESCATNLFSGENSLVCEPCGKGTYIKNDKTSDRNLACAPYYEFYWNILFVAIVVASVMTFFYMCQKARKLYMREKLTRKLDEEMGMGFRAGMDMEFELTGFRETFTMKKPKLTTAQERESQFDKLYAKWESAKTIILSKKLREHENKKILKRMMGLRSAIEVNIRHDMDPMEIDFKLSGEQREKYGREDESTIKLELNKKWSEWAKVIEAINSKAKKPKNSTCLADDVRIMEEDMKTPQDAPHLIKKQQFLKTVRETLSYEKCLEFVDEEQMKMEVREAANSFSSSKRGGWTTSARDMQSFGTSNIAAGTLDTFKKLSSDSAVATLGKPNVEEVLGAGEQRQTPNPLNRGKSRAEKKGERDDVSQAVKRLTERENGDGVKNPISEATKVDNSNKTRNKKPPTTPGPRPKRNLTQEQRDNAKNPGEINKNNKNNL